MKQQLTMLGSSEEVGMASQAVTTTAQDLVDEIRGSLDYYGASTPSHPVERILLCGGGSRLDGLRDRLAQATRLPVVEGDPFTTMRIGNTGLDDHQIDFVKPLAAVPVGLALGAIR